MSVNKKALAEAGIALVTGAAARIGAAIAEILHQRGCDVILHYNSNIEAAQQLADRLNAARAGSASLVSADLSALAGVEQLAGQVKSNFGKLDVLVNNASRFYPTAVGATLAWQWDDLMNSNLKGPYFLAQALLGELRAARGSIINLLDVHSERPMKGHAAYCISKAGLAMMTLALARDLGPDIRVNGVSPGAILWPEDGMSDAAQQTILRQVPLQRPGDPDDIAGCVLYLIRDATYVTGQIIAVDGGRSVGW